MQDDSAESVFMNVQDLIGLRIECRFVEDEQKIFKSIKKEFSQLQGDGFSSIPGYPSVCLKLNESQPQLQKNGFEIYKIDGYYLDGHKKMNFELQIKSLVNVFWGEIDHRVLYKNYNYMLTEDFFRDIMHSIKDNLAMIDRQLMILYDHVNKMDSSAEKSNRVQVKSLLSKIIHDIYVGKIHKELGFVIDFGFSSDIIVEYLYHKCKEILNFSYGENFIRLLNRINAIGDMPIDIHSHIEFERKPVFHTKFTQILGMEIFNYVNVDFGWNLFFKIISQIEQSKPIIDFEEFFHYMEEHLRIEIRKNINGVFLSYNEREEIEETVLEKVAEILAKKTTMDDVLQISFGINVIPFKEIFRNIQTFDEFKENQERILRSIEGKGKYRERSISFQLK